MPILIYTLQVPRDGSVRYVGQTSIGLHKRWREHIKAARNRRGIRNHRCNWIRSLLALGLEPHIALVERCGDNWPEREMYWIRYYKQRTNLTNHSIGGEHGGRGVVCSAETRALISAAQKARPPWNHSETTRQKIRDAQIGRPGPPMKDEVKKKISATQMGRVFSEEHKAKIGEANRKRVVSDETKAKIAASVKKYNEERRKEDKT